MNILIPFDPVSARSVYLLRLFPPKMKRSRRRGERAREIHVHSQVLHMEPGVKTYAIATTIRVVLVKLKKDSNGTLSPSFGWEVDLGGPTAKISSRVSDHGHNGVALTITRRAQDSKSGEVGKDTKGKRGKRAPEAVPVPNLSSTRSVDSLYSDEDEVDDEYPDAENLPQTRYPVDEPIEETAFHDHGATTAGGEVVKWFTVLAEYQHRRQLTALHNAISCIVGDFDSIIVDRGREFEHGDDGICSFGIFGFERGVQDGKDACASNAELVMAFENLPWMHEDMFKKIQNYSRNHQRDFVTNLRQNWVFSRDLKASRAQGGPAWLIEARAKAMFISPEAPTIPEFLDPDDPMVREVLVELEHGKISSEQATELLYSHIEYSLSFDDEEQQQVQSESTRYVPVEELDSKSIDAPRRRANSSDQEVPRNQSTGARRRMSGDPVSQVQAVRLDARLDSDSEMFHSAEFQPQELHAGEDYSGSVPFLQAAAAANSLGHDEQMGIPAHSAPGLDDDFADFRSPMGLAEKKVTAASSNGVNGFAPSLDVSSSGGLAIDEPAVHAQATGVHGQKHTFTPNDSSRIDRMESLMEQLVILNAQQTTQKLIVPTEIFSDAPSVGESGMADELKNELSELRAQVQARVEEDNALHDEITALREQLAERRSARPTPEKPSSEYTSGKLRKFKLWSAKKQEAESNKDGQAKNEQDTPMQESKPTPETILTASGTGDIGGSIRKGSASHVKVQRRPSGDSMGPDQRLNRTVSGDSVEMERRMARRYSGGGMGPGKTARLNSAGSELRMAPQRRLSDDQQVRWE
jgi:regulator of replication initiation timing